MTLLRKQAWWLAAAVGLSGCAPPEDTEVLAAEEAFAVPWSVPERLPVQGLMDRDAFGAAVALDGEVAIVGAPGSVITQPGGAVYFFKRGPDGWKDAAVSKISNGPGPGRFGAAIALSNDMLFVGAPGAGNLNVPGAVQPFHREEGHWSRRAPLAHTAAQGNDLFGMSIAAFGDTLVVGAPSHDVAGLEDAGLVYVFERGSKGFHEVDRLKAPASVASAHFGWDLALFGETLVVAARFEPSGVRDIEGVVRVYSPEQGKWKLRQTVLPPEACEQRFATALALSEDTLMIGADFSNGVRGKVFAYENASGTWSPAEQLTSEQASSGDHFGGRIALDRGVAVIGSGGVSANGALGVAHLFAREQTWIEAGTMQTTSGMWGDLFGRAIAVRDRTVIVGAPGVEGSAMDLGAAFVSSFGRPNGFFCTTGDTCVSGFCAEGVCCNTACDSVGYTCLATVNTPEGNGTCTLRQIAPISEGPGPRPTRSFYSCCASPGAVGSSAWMGVFGAVLFLAAAARRKRK